MYALLFAGGVSWAEFISGDFRLRPASPAAVQGYAPPTFRGKGGPSGGPIDVLDSADAAAANDAQNLRIQRASALIPDLATKKSSAW